MDSDIKPVYDRDPELNAIITELMNDWDRLIEKAKSYGLDIRLYPESVSLELYFHNDYPDTLLVDKYFSSMRKESKNATECL